MQNFDLTNVTDLIFGEGTERQVGKYIREFGGSRVLIVHTGEPFVLPLIENAKHDIEAEGMTCVELPGVVPNPRVELVLEGAELARREQIDFVLAVGGGSTIDTAKSVAFAAVNPEIDLWSLYDWRDITDWIYPVLPLGVISTFAGTGSEMTYGACLNRGKEKGVFDYIGMRAKFCILDPKLTLTMPPFQTASGAADIFSHLLEIFFSEEPSDLADNFIRGGLQTVLKHAPAVMRDPEDLHAREELMATAPICVYGIMKPGRGGDWGVHFIEHILSGEYDIAHGAGLALLTPIWMRRIHRRYPGLFVKLATEVFGLPMGSTVEETALSAIDATERFFFEDLRLPRTLYGNGVTETPTEADIDRMTGLLFAHGETSVGGNLPLDREDCYQIIRECCLAR